MAKATEMLVKLKKTRKATSMSMTSIEAQGLESRCALKLKLPKALAGGNRCNPIKGEEGG
jgi:hypothetical protein